MRTYRPSARPRFCLLHALILILLSGCANRERITVVVEEPPDSAVWTYGETRSIDVPAVPGCAVLDSASATLFRCPSGGGRLTIRDVAAGPSTLADEGAIDVDYTGNGGLELLLPHQPGDRCEVMAYAPLDGVVLEIAEPDTFGWLPLVHDELRSGASGDTFVYVLPANPAGRKQGGLYSFGTYKQIFHEPNSGWVYHYIMIERNIRSACNSLLEAIPVSLQAEVRARINGPMMPILSVPENRAAWVWKTKPKYQPFGGLPGLRPIYQIVIPVDAASSVAHEVSHYIHHVLLEGDYAKFAWNSRPGHEIGSAGAMAQLIEDMAYLGEYFLNGDISGANPKWGSTLAGNPENRRSPKTTDFRDLEGMAVAVFAAHIRDSDRITDYEGRWTTVPVIPGDETEKFRDCYRIVAEGTDDVLELVDKMEGLLQSTYGGRGAALPAMLEPLGWSYHVKMRFVDESGRVVPGVEARSVCKTPDGEFLLPKRGTPSGDNGTYTLDKFYPKKSTLRAYIGRDSMDVADITIPWSHATNVEHDIGDVILDASPLRIDSIDPPAAPPGTDVWIAGSSFGTSAGVVRFGTAPAEQILAWTDFGCRAVIPSGASPGAVEVTVTARGRTSNAVAFFIEDDLFAALHRTTHANVHFHAWHSFEPWDSGDDETFSQPLQHLQWDGDRFSALEREVTDQRRLKITCQGQVSLAERTVTLEYEVADTTFVGGATVLLHKRARFAAVPFGELSGGVAEFKVEGAAVQPCVPGPLVWSHDGYGGGQYTETHWDWSPEENHLSIRFQRQ